MFYVGDVVWIDSLGPYYMDHKLSFFDNERELIKSFVHNFTGTVKFGVNKFLYYKNGLIHREEEEGAAFIASGIQIWFSHGRKNREGGPAVIYTDTGREPEWWYQDVLYGFGLDKPGNFPIN